MLKVRRYVLWRMLSYRLMSTKKIRVFIFIVFLLLAFLFLVCRHSSIKFSKISQASALYVYKHAEKLRINGKIDPPCIWSIRSSIYTCSGYCPWVTQKMVKCTFLQRVVNRNFEQNGMYCTPPSDDCLSHNAWLKEELPLTLNPIHTIPIELISNFTLNGLIPVNYNIGFRFSNYSGSGLNWSINYVNRYRNQVKQRQAFGTYQTTALYPVLETYSKRAIRNKKCAVIGSEYPWIEAALLEFEAATVTTIEYNHIISEIPNLFVITPSMFAAAQERNAIDGNLELFDSVWCYSSIEHDGLGRYTDPINPYGDFQTMIKISCMLKPGGLLFLAVPTNKYDGIHFNLHRVYGPVRFPLLYRYFHLVQVFGKGFAVDPNDYSWQPILVLQNKIGCQ